MARYWVLVAVTAALLIFRDDVGAWLSASSSEPSVGPKAARAASEIVLNKSGDGHFWADADINGASVRMLADTGASVVALSVEDAEAAGIDVDQLNFNTRVTTAGGQARAAEVELDEVRVGSIVRNDVRAIVARELPRSLLGMSFFSTLSKVSFESDELVLKD